MLLQNFLVAGLLIYGALAAPTKTHTAENFSVAPRASGPAASSLTVVDETEKQKSCPTGYQMLGKQCARTITMEPEVTCQTGYELRTTEPSARACVKYVGLESECPPGFTRTLGVCSNTRSTTKGPVCPDGFNLRSDEATCQRLVQLPDREACPAGSEPKGDICIVRGTGAPQFVCSPGFRLEGNKCEIEETYDCTPMRPALFSGLFDKMHRRLAGKDSYGIQPVTPSSFSFLAPAAPASNRFEGFYEDYVVQSTCKRIRIEHAQKVCPDGVLEGKVCALEVQVQPMMVPGGSVEEVIPAAFECPPGFSTFSDTSDECSFTEEVAPSYFCPTGAEDLGDRCAYYSASRRVCATGFALEGNLCVQTEFAPPLIEYTVTYSCVGKECAGH